MERESAFSNSISNYEDDFRIFRKATLTKIEQEIQQAHANWDVQQEIGLRIYEQTKPIFKKSGLDVDQLDVIEESERNKLDEFLARVRPQFIERNPQFNARLREEAVDSIYYSHSGWSEAFLIGADVYDANPENLETYEGESGNPSKWLYDAKKKWKGKAVIGGSQGCTLKTPFHPAGNIWYYTWLPPAKGNYNILAGMYYHGFHLVYAYYVPPFPFCTYAWVRAKASLRVGVKKPYPKYPVGIAQQDRDIIDTGGNVYASSGVLDGSAVLSTTVNYTGGSPLYINVILSLQVVAKGYLTHAEINFQDGQANYVNPPFVIITSTP